MLYLKSFIKYLEQAAPDVTDRDMQLSTKNTKEDYKKMMDDFNKNKNLIEVIFSDKSLDDAKRSERLKPFLKDGNTQKMVFTNDLLRVWADICNLKRKMVNLDDQIKSKSSDKGQSFSEENLKLLKQVTSNLENEKENLRQELLRKEKEKETKFDEYEKELKKLEQELRTNK